MPKVIKESTPRHCFIYKANNNKWYMELAAHEHEYEDRHITTYGPFGSEDEVNKHLDNFSNPGSLDVDDTGTKPVPTKSPNGRPVQSPIQSKTRYGRYPFGFYR